MLMSNFLLSAGFIIGQISNAPAVESAGPKTLTVGLAANFSAVVDTTADPTLNFPRKSAELALSEFESELKSRGIKIQFQEFDYQDDKVKTLETAQALSKSDVIAVVGYTNSSDALLAGPILNKAGIPFLAPSATAERVEDIGRFVRRICFDDAFQGRIMADFAAKDQGLKKVAIVSVSDCAYCQSLRNSFRDRFITNGGSIVADETILSNDTGFEKLAANLKSKGNLDAIFVPNYERTAARLLPQLIDAGVQPKFWIAGDGWGTTLSLFNRLVGKRSYTAFAIAHWRPETGNAVSKSFYSRFKATYNLEPNDTAVLSYDATRLLIQAILKAKSLSREGVMESIEKLDHLEGASGTIAYSAGRRTPSKPAVLVKMHDGDLRVERLISESRLAAK